MPRIHKDTVSQKNLQSSTVPVRILYTNLGSLPAKFDELLVRVESIKPDIILITETWLKDNIPDNLVTITGFDLFRSDRPDRKGGGVCVFVKNAIGGVRTIASVESDLLLTSNEIELIRLKIFINHVPLHFACIYKPPSCSEGSNQELCDFIIQVSNLNLTTLMFGDFNYPDIEWHPNTPRGSSNCAKNFLDAYNSSNFHQLVQEPTRFRHNQEPSLLDLLLVTEENLITDLQFSNPIGSSDHAVIVAELQVSTPLNRTLKPIQLDYWNVNYQQVNEYIKQLPPEQYPSKIENLDRLIEETTDTFVPVKRPRKVYCKPWINKELVKQINKKRKLWDKYKATKADADYKAYRTFNNRLHSLLRETRRTYENRLLQYGSNQFYKYISSTLTNRINGFAINDPSTGKLILEEKEVATVFAKQFCDTYVREPPGELPHLPPETRVPASLEYIQFTAEKVKAALADLKSHASPGPDLVSPIFLKNCADTISPLIAEAMSESFNNTKVPETWKSATVIPIYKKGDRLNPNNYRPISLTSVLSKCMEKILAREITQFIISNNIIPPTQHGFMPGRSVTSNLLQCIDDWTRAHDSGEPMDVIYLDFQKAFDTVPVNRLIHKLQHLGIRGKLLAWIKEYLTNRKFRVRIGSSYSEEHTVLSGVPQGSVLGPLLFIIYVSDMSRGIQNSISYFADDTKIFGDPTLTETGLAADLLCLEVWTSDWLLKLNVNKCKVLHMGPNNPHHQYAIDGDQLPSTSEQLDLGVIVRGDLKWESQVQKVVKKANSLIYLINRAFRDISEEMLLKIYKTYIRPVLEHAVVAWSPYFKKDIELLERVQRRVSKMPRTLKRLPYEQRLLRLGLTTLEERRKRGDLIETFKILRGHYSCEVCSFLFSNVNHLRGHLYRLIPERCNRLPRKQFLPNRVVAEWNGLPENAVLAPSTNAFKIQLAATSTQL